MDISSKYMLLPSDQESQYRQFVASKMVKQTDTSESDKSKTDADDKISLKTSVRSTSLDSQKTPYDTDEAVNSQQVINSEVSSVIKPSKGRESLHTYIGSVKATSKSQSTKGKKLQTSGDSVKSVNRKTLKVKPKQEVLPVIKPSKKDRESLHTYAGSVKTPSKDQSTKDKKKKIQVFEGPVKPVNRETLKAKPKQSKQKSSPYDRVDGIARDLVNNMKRKHNQQEQTNSLVSNWLHY